MKLTLALFTILSTLSFTFSRGNEPTRDEAQVAMRRAVRFFTEEASMHGGYVYRWSSDLKRREGEETVGESTAWLEPPGTPAVGAAYLEAYQLTRDPLLLAAARKTAAALIQGQLMSGGWDNSIEFDPKLRQSFAYRVDGGPIGKRRNQTTLDDDKTQSAVRFLQRLDRELKFKDAELHEATLYALDHILAAQYPNGAWPQRFSEPVNAAEFPVLRASYPPTWSREYPGDKYTTYYTLNDNTLSDMVSTCLESAQIYGDRKYLEAARRGGEFLILAQMPAPQPGWAQQYDAKMHPAWARKFEPPAISGGESQMVMRTLMLLYRHTKDSKFLQPIPSALAYYRTCKSFDGELARFYELQTNRPLFFTKKYVLTYSPDDVPTHYGFLVRSSLDKIEKEFSEINKSKSFELLPQVRPPKPSAKLSAEVANTIAAIDSRGAWVTVGKLKDDENEGPVIESKVFMKNLAILAGYIATETK